MPAVHVRVDTIEQALLRAGLTASNGHEGYLVAYGMAADNLRLGHRVIADCVNARQASRDAWAQVAQQCGVAFLPVYLFCSDAQEHRRRVSERRADIDGHMLPTWEQVAALQCDSPVGGVTIDTSASSVATAVELILRGAE